VLEASGRADLAPLPSPGRERRGMEGPRDRRHETPRRGRRHRRPERRRPARLRPRGRIPDQDLLERGKVMLHLLLACVCLQTQIPKFREETIETQSGGAGYNSCLADVNGDGRVDLILVTENKDQVIWYENPYPS